MSQGIGSWMAMVALAGALAFSSGATAQTAAPAPAENAAPTADNAVMLTVFLKHDQSRPLSELNAQLDRQAGDNGVDAALFDRRAALRPLQLVVNVVIDRVIMSHRLSSG